MEHLRVFDPATRNAPGLCQSLSLQRQRAQGKPGARCTRSRAWWVESTRVSHHRSTGTPGLPCAMVLTVSFALSPVIGLVCHRRQWSRLHQLDASVEASGPHDFAVRFGAVVYSAIHVHRIPPRVRDDRDTPLGGRNASDGEVIWV
jgi:hypothetical protein